MSNISGIVKSARKIMRQDTGTGSDELRILQLGWMLFLKIYSSAELLGMLHQSFAKGDELLNQLKQELQA